MKKLFLTCMFGVSLFFIACGGNEKDEPTPPAEQPHRTVLAYIVSDNSLNSFSSSDINEMLVGIQSVDTKLNNLLVYVDDNATPVLYRITKDKNGIATKEIIREYEEQVSTTPQVMKEVCTQVFTNYPAQSYGLIYWSHGEGWKPMPLTSSTRWIGQDKGGGTTDYTNIDELKEVLASVPHLDFLIYDACFMMSIEAAYTLRNEVDYIIASPTEIPGPGAPYDALVPAMFKQGNTAIDIAKAYYTTYNQLYNGGVGNSDTHWTAGVSIGVLKTAPLQSFAQLTKQLLGQASNIDLEDIQQNILNYDKRSKSSSNYVGYYDMAQLMQALLTSSDFSSWQAAFEGVMPYYQTTEKNYSSYAGMFSMQGTYGLSHYLPCDNQALNAAYAQTEWYKDVVLATWGW